MSIIKAVIIDDELMARTLLQSMIADCVQDIEVVETCANLATGIKAIRKYKPQLVFLDIEMPGSSGLEILDFFEPEEVDFSIIFVTAYDQYALRAFKLSAVDYLLKPIEPSDIEAAVEKYRKATIKTDYSILKENLSSGTGSKKIVIPTSNSVKFLELDTITHIQADGAYTHIFMNDNTKITASKNLKTFESIVADFKNFYRCHKSFIVNLNFVSEYIKNEGGQLLVNNIHRVDISNDKVAPFLELMSDL